jgi:hypothetical protein
VWAFIVLGKHSEEFALALKPIIIAQREESGIGTARYGESATAGGRSATRECVSIVPA